MTYGKWLEAEAGRLTEAEAKGVLCALIATLDAMGGEARVSLDSIDLAITAVKR